MSAPLILIAEDNPGLARVLSYKLRASGFQTSVANDGTAAWQQFQDCQPDAVLSDHEMPGMTGVELCEQIRRSTTHAGVPFILVTGRQLELQATGIVEQLDIQALFAKPFSPKDIVRTLQQCLPSNVTPATPLS
ncbi:response regulator [Roseimaritima ulvae]|uniref:Sensory transduction protein regX3 n=1 Tax=Roseimaritima ulvae TaxID=980254 RepID=A0A5B9QM57_9BACT|nr:response regulator [Roseimaritima ulvae]QEG38575.1 Sensory transduction protein regX3 [Roseimaritima ulvae]